MILSDKEIKTALRQKQIFIDPAPREDQYTSSALDLCLSSEIKEMKTNHELQADQPPGVASFIVIDASAINLAEYLLKYAKPVHKEPDGSYILPPKKFVLGITLEYIQLPRESKIAARVEGRSTLARLGLAVHLTAPTIHAGFSGRIVLEMFNFGEHPLRLRENLVICQLIFERLGKVPSGPPRTRHQGQTKI